MKVAMTTMEAKMNIHIKCFSEMCFVFFNRNKQLEKSQHKST